MKTVKRDGFKGYALLNDIHKSSHLQEVREQLRGMTLRDLVLTGREVCRSLIMALLDR